MKRWIGVVLLVLVAMSLGRLLTDHVDVDTSRRFVEEGEVGKTVRLDWADFTVDGVRSARWLSSSETTEAVGVFVIVDTRMSARRKSVNVAGIDLVTRDGRRYPAETETYCGISQQLLVGGTHYGMFCFDVPADADVLTGAHVEYARARWLPRNGFSQRREQVASIDLGIGHKEAEELASSRLMYPAVAVALEEYEKDPITYEGAAP